MLISIPINTFEYNGHVIICRLFYDMFFIYITLIWGAFTCNCTFSFMNKVQFRALNSCYVRYLIALKLQRIKKAFYNVMPRIAV